MVEYKGRIVRTEYVGYATVKEVKREEARVAGMRESPSRLRTLTLKESADIAEM